MERRFKIISISVQIVASYGKDFERALLRELGPEAQVLMKESDIYTGTLVCLIYDPCFPRLAPKTSVPSMPFNMAAKEATTILTFDA